MAQGIPLHQTLELHELMTFKNACAAKASMMSGLAQDSELKSLLGQDLAMSKRHIQELQGLMQGSM